MKRLAVLLVIMVFFVSACTVTIYPYGRWSGAAYINENRAGTIEVDYNEGWWRWCRTTYNCVGGYTSGWDLIDRHYPYDRLYGYRYGDTVRIEFQDGWYYVRATLVPDPFINLRVEIQ